MAFTKTVATACLDFLFLLPVGVQSPSFQQKEKATQYRAQPDAAEWLSIYLASKLYLSKYAELHFGKMAAERATTFEVRQFAKIVVDDHLRMLQKLKRFVFDAVIQNVDELNDIANLAAPARSQERTERLDNREIQSPEPMPVTDRLSPACARKTRLGRSNQCFDATDAVHVPDIKSLLMHLSRIDVEVMKIQMERASQVIQKKRGPDFDLAYVEMQMGGQVMMEAKWKAIQEIGSSEFQQLAISSLRTIQQHLDLAKGIARRQKNVA